MFVAVTRSMGLFVSSAQYDVCLWPTAWVLGLFVSSAQYIMFVSVTRSMGTGYPSCGARYS